GLTMAPYNVYPTLDGSIAILTVSDAHWNALTSELGCETWRTDPRFITKTDRVRNIDALDEALGAVTRRFAKAELFERLVAVRVPCAPVRELDEVVNDPHLHETGMLKWVQHPEY